MSLLSASRWWVCVLCSLGVLLGGCDGNPPEPQPDAGASADAGAGTDGGQDGGQDGGEVPHLNACSSLTCSEGFCSHSQGVPLCMVERDLGNGAFTFRAERVVVPESVATLPDTLAAEGTVAEGVAHQALFFSFEATAGHWYRLEVQCSAGWVCSGVFADATGRLISQEELLSFSEGVVMKAEAAGRYVLALGAAGVAGRRYSLRVVDVGPDDHGNVAATATALTGTVADVTGRGEVTGDLDAFSIPVEQGRRFFFACSAGDPTARLRWGVPGADGRLTPEPWSPQLFLAATESPVIVVESRREQAATALDYTCHFRNLEVDDHADGLEGATMLAAPGRATGFFEREGDLDTFAVPLRADRYFRATCTSGTGSSASSCWLRVLRPDGTLLRDVSPFDPMVKAPESGTYGFEVRGNMLQLFTLVIEDVSADDHGDVAATATSVQPGEQRMVTREYAGDVDAFAFDVPAGAVRRFGCERTDPTDSNMAWYLTLRDGSGAALDQASMGTWDSDAAVAVEAVQAARYVVEVRGHTSSFPASPIVRCALEALDPDDHGDTLADATALGAATFVRGRLETRGDVDAFSFTLEAGHFLSLTWSGGAALLKDSDGKVVAGPADSWRTSLEYRAPRTGTYVMELRATDAWSAKAGDYTATREDRGADDHGDAPDLATPLVLDTTVSGSRQAQSDEDYFTFPVTERGIYRLVAWFEQPTGTWNLPFELDAFQKPASEAYDPASGTYLVDAFRDGTVFLRIRTQGRYTLRLEALAQDDHGDMLEKATPLTLGVPVSGVGEALTDKDAFSISLEAGHTYRAIAETAHGASVWVSPPTGFSLDVGAGAPFVAPQSGLYTVSVFPALGTSIPVGPYVLTLQE